MLFAIKSVSNLQKDNAIYRRINYLHATETSSTRSVSCIFGVVLLLEREPRRQTNADLKMANETRVLIHVIEIQIIAWSASNKSPQTHTIGMSSNYQPYLHLIASLNSLLLRVKFISFKGITLSQLEAPFSFMNSTAR